MTARIRLVEDDADRMAIYRFRYDVYVKEMKRVQKHADHALGIVKEPLDNTGHLLLAEDAGHVVGTARFHVGVDENFGFYEHLYNFRVFGPFYPSSVSMTTKLMVAPEYRQSLLPLQLSVCCYKHGLRLGTVFDVIDCNLPLVPFFSKLGYRQIFPIIQHPEYGDVIPMVLALHDLEHLRSVGSPFVRHARTTTNHKGSVSYFRDRLLPLRRSN